MLTLVFTVEQVCEGNDCLWEIIYHCAYLQIRQESAHHDREAFELGVQILQSARIRTRLIQPGELPDVCASLPGADPRGM